MSVKVGMILDVDFPPDDRPEKEAISLQEAGYEVFLLCYTSSKKQNYERYKGIHISRFRLSKFLHNKLSAAYLVLPFYRWIWAYQIKRFIIKNNLDILHIHDLPLSDVSQKYADKYGLKVVCDQHEYWSNWIGNTFHYNTLIGKIVKFLSNWKKFEYTHLHRADLVITVSDNLRQLYIQDHHLSPDKIITVPNTPSQKIFNQNNINRDVVSKYESEFMLFYAGTIDILRGIDLIIDAMVSLTDKIPAMKLVLAGRFARGCNILDQVKSLGMQKNVEYLGWLAVDQIPSYIAASKVCIFTPPPEMSEEINNTIPTKIYQYISMKKPVIVSNAKMMKELIENNGLGLSIDAYSAQILAEKLLYLYENYAIMESKIRQNSQKLIDENNIFWDQTVQRMINFYGKFLR